MGEEIDLTAYLDMLLRRWKLVVGIALVVPIMTVAIIMLLPPSYRARALVATTREKTRVSLGTSIVTLSEDDLESEISPERRLTTFVAMVPNPLIAQQVLDEIGHLLPNDLQNVSALLQMVEGAVAKDSDAIAIDMTHTDPQIAALLANAWARAYVEHVNRTYGGDAGEVLGIVRAEIEIARTAYEDAQSSLSDLLRDERFDVLNRRMVEVQALLQSLSDARAGAGRVTLERLDRIDRLLASASDMRDQIAAGGEAAAQNSILAFALLKADAFALADQTQNQTPALIPAPWSHPLDPSPHLLMDQSRSSLAESRAVDFQVALDAPMAQVSATEMLADLSALITTLESRRATLLNTLLNLAQSAGDSQEWSTVGLLPLTGANGQRDDTLPRPDAAQSQLEQLARDLRVQVLAEADRLAQAQNRASLARETLNNLERKDAELALSVLTTGAEARMAVPATMPTHRETSPIKTGVLAAATGLTLGVVAAYGTEFWIGYRRRMRTSRDAERPA